MLRGTYLCVLAAFTPLLAQTPAPPAAFAAAEKRAIEWNVLANNLELRLARLLPCDARVRSAIDEVNLASEARLASLAAYWQGLAAASLEQSESLKRSITELEAAAALWKNDTADADEEGAAIAERAALLTASARNAPALANARNMLDKLSQASLQSADQVRLREAAAESVLFILRDNLAAHQARQTAFDNAMKALAEEGQRWRSYYAARTARAQTECAITQRTAAPKPTAIRPAPKAAPLPGKKERP